MPKPAGWILLVCLLVCGVLSLSGLVLGGLAVVGSPTPWLTVAFEVLIVVAGLMGVLLGLGRFSEGPALGMVCVAGAVCVGALLGGVGSEWRVGGGVLGAGVGLKMPLMIRAGLCGVLVLLAGIVVLSRDWRRSRGHLVKGLLASVALVGLLAGAYAARGSLGQFGAMSKAIAGMLGFVLATGLLAAATQWLITAFEMGSASRFEKSPDETGVRDVSGGSAGSSGGAIAGGGVVACDRSSEAGAAGDRAGSGVEDGTIADGSVAGAGQRGAAARS